MNLWFRMMRIFLMSGISKKISLFDQSRIRFRVWPTDCDINLHMNNGRFLTLMDLGRTYFMAQLRMLWTLPKKGWYPVVGAVEIRYLRPLDPFQKFEILTKVLTWDDKWIYLEQRFESNRKPYAVARLRALFLEKNGRIPTGEIVRLVTQQNPSPPPDSVVNLWSREGDQAY